MDRLKNELNGHEVGLDLLPAFLDAGATGLITSRAFFLSVLIVRHNGNQEILPVEEILVCASFRCDSHF